MNIYTIIEDGEKFLIKAKTPKAAIDLCLAFYLESVENEEDYSKEYETNYYFDEILMSVSLVGKLRN